MSELVETFDLSVLATLGWVAGAGAGAGWVVGVGWAGWDMIVSLNVCGGECRV